jgi:hypothetical protein
MLSFTKIFSQNSLGLNSVNSISDLSFSSLNSFEFNPSNYSAIKDWGFSLTYGAEFADEINSSLYQLSAGKVFGKSFLSLRYSPGFQKEFIVKTNQQVTFSDENNTLLESKFLYRELFGAGYSYLFNSELSAGINFRYFKQDFTNEFITTIISDTIYFLRETEEESYNNWIADLGLVWKPINNLFLNVGSINLINIAGQSINQKYDDFKLKQKSGMLAGITYYPINNFSFNFSYETSSALVTGTSYLIGIDKTKLGLTTTAFHDPYQEPFFAGLNASVIMISKYFDLSLSWLNYFSDKSTSGSLEDFRTDGISSIINNQYSFDKILFSANFKLNTTAEQKIKFIDVNINQNIYPTLSDKFIKASFATAKVVNLTNDRLEIKPSLKISNLSNEIFTSAVYFINPLDTADINYYLLVPDNYKALNPEISYANFYISTSGDNIDDEIQKPVIINGLNAWDGEVVNLKYFIQKDLNFSVQYSKEIISRHKTELDTVKIILSDFYKIKFIFNSFVKNLSYISDPRATAEYVQFPRQTIELKGGDCDDLSVCFSSLLESVGIETALVDYQTDEIRHVNVLVNTKLSPQQASLITENDSKYFIRKNSQGNDEVWLPIETTSLSDFDEAWLIGSEKFNESAINNFGLVKGSVNIIDVY